MDVLDTLGSSMSNLNPSGGFAPGMAIKGNKISMLAFEVANTIGKGATLFQSVSGENVQFLKKEILHSEGVKQLVSTDMRELLSLAAADKRSLIVSGCIICYAFDILLVWYLRKLMFVVTLFLHWHLQGGIGCFFKGSG